jgi:ATP-binding cassette subfamily C (CFTR/MRP) protein 1
MSTIFDAVQTRTLFLSTGNSAVSILMTASIAMKVILLVLESQNKRQFLKPAYLDSSPEATSGVISRSLFWWLNGLFRSGFSRLMTYDDLYTIDDALKSENIGPRMIQAWERRGELAVLRGGRLLADFSSPT